MEGEGTEELSDDEQVHEQPHQLTPAAAVLGGPAAPTHPSDLP